MESHMFHTRRSVWLAACALAALAPALAASEKETPRARDRVIRVERDPVVRIEKEPRIFFFSDPEGFGGGYLGVALLDLTPELRRHFGAPEDVGAMVSRVEPDGPAAKAGVEVGDILTAVDGEAVRGSWAITSRIRRHEAGDSVGLELYRSGKARTVTASLEERQRRLVDIAPMIHGRTLSAPEGEFDVELMGPAMQELRGLLDDPERRRNLRLLRERESELQQKLEQRLKELEKRLQELEKQLGDKG
jgi:hypothetical protein